MTDYKGKVTESKDISLCCGFSLNINKFTLKQVYSSEYDIIKKQVWNHGMTCKTVPGACENVGI